MSPQVRHARPGWPHFLALSLIALTCHACSERATTTSSDQGAERSQANANDTGPARPDNLDADLPSEAAPPDADGSVERSAAPLDALIRMEDARRLSRPVVERMLKSPDVVLRRRTLLALGRVGDAEAIGPLRTALTDSDPQSRRVALRSLGMLEESAHPDVEKVLTSFLALEPRLPDRREAIASLGRVGQQESAPTILAAFESPEPRMRSTAAKALGAMGIRGIDPGEQALVSLASHLSDAESSVRLASAYALSRCTKLTETSRPVIGSALAKTLRQDDDTEVRIMAGRALGRIDAGQMGYLIAALEHDEDWRVRAVAATSLGRNGTAPQRARGLKRAWKRLADDPERLTSPELHPLLALVDAVASNPSQKLAHQLQIIQRSASKLVETTTNPRARVALAHVQCQAALARDRAQGRSGAVRRCATTDPPLISELQRKLLIVHALDGSTVPGALNQLKRLLRDPEEQVRVAAVDAVGSHFTPLRLSLLERALLDDSPHVVAAAAYKLSTAGEHYNPVVTNPSQQLTVTEHTDAGPVTYSLATPETKGREPPVTAITKALSKVDAESDVETAINLLRVIGGTKASKAAPVARQWAGHHNQSVRREARKALEANGLEPGPELQPDPPNLVEPERIQRVEAGTPAVILTTSVGEVIIELRPDIAPMTVANFLELSRRGFYDGLRFHRVVPGFVIQGGDPSGTGYGGPGHTIRCELNDEPYERGTVGMALAGPDTGGSQFFITYSAQPHLDRRYTVFGRVSQGMDVVDALQPWDRIITARPR